VHPSQVGEQLHVNAAGRHVRKAGENCVLPLISSMLPTGFASLSETYDATEDILAVQSYGARRVVEALQVALGVDDERALAKKATEIRKPTSLPAGPFIIFAKFTRAGLDQRDQLL